MYEFNYSYKDFPKWQDSTEGMQILEGDPNNTKASIWPLVEYDCRDDYHLHIRFMFPLEMDESKRYPLIIHCKGSGWEQQNLESNLADFAPVVKAGYGLAFIQYRPANIAKYPAQVHDLKNAARYILNHAEQFPIDLNHVFLAGDSSGGHTAIMSYLTWGEPVLDEYDDPLPTLSGLIDYYGVTNVRKLAETDTGMSKESNALLLDFLFAEKTEAEFAQANFACYIDLKEKLPPVLILHGNKDRLVPLSQSVEFFEALKARGTDCQFYMVNNSDHGGCLFFCPAVTDTIIKFLRENS